MIVGMKAGDLEFAFPVKLLEEPIGEVEKVVVVGEVFEILGDDQNRGFDFGCGMLGEVAQFRLKVGKQVTCAGGLANLESNFLLASGFCGEGAKVEANDDAIEPLFDLGDDLGDLLGRELRLSGHGG